jgi:hypothetical protein
MNILKNKKKVENKMTYFEFVNLNVGDQVKCKKTGEIGKVISKKHRENNFAACEVFAKNEAGKFLSSLSPEYLEALD